eukprot:4809327-Prymnesium_polylepis.1
MAPKAFECPISGEVMIDPVTCADGHTYEREQIERWFATGAVTSPATGAPLPHMQLIPNHALRNAIEEFTNAGQSGERPWTPSATHGGGGSASLCRSATNPSLGGGSRAAAAPRQSGSALLDEGALLGITSPGTISARPSSRGGNAVGASRAAAPRSGAAVARSAGGGGVALHTQPERPLST